MSGLSRGISLVVGLAVAVFVSPSQSLRAQDGDSEAAAVSEMTLGNEDAPVTLIEYASFTCPHCATFHEDSFRRLKEDFIDAGKIKFVFREVYFDRFGLWASMIARCAGPDRYFGVVDLLFERQSSWSRAGGPSEIATELRKVGLIAGVDGERLDACLRDSAKAEALVAWYRDNASAHEIDATPSFVLNGQKLKNQAYEDLKALIENELEQARATLPTRSTIQVTSGEGYVERGMVASGAAPHQPDGIQPRTMDPETRLPGRPTESPDIENSLESME